jgi:hypothetical protein
MKLYISSTYRDLSEHRAAVDRALRRMGHDVIGMEQYVAEDGRPLTRCLADVRAADAYVVILAWRYGYVPTADNCEGCSITELEYREALAANKPVLAFLLDPSAPWPPSEMDGMSAERQAAAGIERLRADVGRDHLAGIFRAPEDLASQVSAAVAAQGATIGLIERLLSETSVTAGDMGAFGSGGAINDSSLMSIKDMVTRVGESRALVVDLGMGDDWWSTRLYLLASLSRVLTPVRQIVFRRGDGTFAGMASPSAVIDGLAAQFPILLELGGQVAGPGASQDREREIERQFDAWRALLTSEASAKPPARGARTGRARSEKSDTPPPLPGEVTGDAIAREREVKVSVRAELLDQWLSDRLFTRCIQVDAEGPNMVQIQQIVESVLPDVPIERAASPGADEPVSLQVVDRDAFALELARQWVRSGLPRSPVR